MIASVLEHLDVKPRHILAHSAGIYHALYLLNHHLDIFDLTSRSPAGPLAGPYVYFVAPWSPILPTTHPEYYTSYLSLIPTKLIETQHVTVRSHSCVVDPVVAETRHNMPDDNQLMTVATSHSCSADSNDGLEPDRLGPI